MSNSNPPQSDNASEFARDIAAARNELRNRRAQVVADFEERLTHLDELLQQHDGGNLDARSAQGRLRQLLVEKSSGGNTQVMPRGGVRTGAGGSVGGAARSAGSTPGLGPSSPMVTATAAAPAMRPSISTTLVEASISRAVQSLDARVGVLMFRTKASEKTEAKLEVSLLLGLRRSLAHHMENPGTLPTDTILLASLFEQCEDIEKLLVELDSNPEARWRRFLVFTRELSSRAAALGVIVAGARDQLQRAKTSLAATPVNLKLASTDIVAAFSRLYVELERRFPPASPVWLDEVMRN